MSASLLVDAFNTVQFVPSVVGDPVLSGVGPSPASGGSSPISIVGGVCDMLLSDTYTNLYVAGGLCRSGGPLVVGVQTSDSTTSGTFTDPTSGLAALPGAFTSGGLFTVASGTLSGFMTGPGFQRPHRYARAA